MVLTPSGVDNSDDSADSMVEKGINFGGLEEAFCAKEGSYDVRDMLMIAFAFGAISITIVQIEVWWVVCGLVVGLLFLCAFERLKGCFSSKFDLNSK
jgi:hypothetical protein